MSPGPVSGPCAVCLRRLNIWPRKPSRHLGKQPRLPPQNLFLSGSLFCFSLQEPACSPMKWFGSNSWSSPSLLFGHRLPHCRQNLRGRPWDDRAQGGGCLCGKHDRGRGRFYLSRIHSCADSGNEERAHLHGRSESVHCCSYLRFPLPSREDRRIGLRSHSVVLSLAVTFCFVLGCLFWAGRDSFEALFAKKDENVKHNLSERGRRWNCHCRADT